MGGEADGPIQPLVLGGDFEMLWFTPHVNVFLRTHKITVETKFTAKRKRYSAKGNGAWQKPQSCASHPCRDIDRAAKVP